jgi:hypothetical protein
MITAPQRRTLASTVTPAAFRRSHPLAARVIRETLVVVLAALLYFFVRGLMHSQAGVAFAHAETLIALEQSLGIFHEPSMQGWVTDARWQTDLANRAYIFGHWPVIALTLAWLVWKRPGAFARYRTAMLLSGAIGLVFFVLLPMAPPRFLTDQGFVDTVTQHSEAYRVLQPPAFTNQYAAMPSLHVGWNLLMGIAIVSQARALWAKAFGWLMPLAMWLATIVTANHYILDGLVGSAVALAGLGLAIWLERRSQRRARPEEPALPRGRSIGQGWSHRAAA